MIMTKIDKNMLAQLRELTGCGMMDCKAALEQSGGNLDEAVDILRKKGAALATKRSTKETVQGIVKAYIHPGDMLGVLLEINCETDFVARTEDVSQFASEVCMQIAALNPLYLTPEEVDPKFLEHEKSVLREQLAGSGKPAHILDSIIEGKLKKLYSEICLLEQLFIKDDSMTIRQRLEQLIAKTGENVRIRRFARFEVGK
jgi:elongation factor Ts